MLKAAGETDVVFVSVGVERVNWLIAGVVDNLLFRQRSGFRTVKLVSRCIKVNRAGRSEVIASLFPDICIEGVEAHTIFTPHLDLEGQPGWVQGGFVATVLDYVCARAATETFGGQAITGNLTIRYISPVLLEGGPYEVRAAVALRSDAEARAGTRRTLRINGSVINPDGERVVTASGLFIRRVSAS